MDYDLAPCPYCELENARLRKFSERGMFHDRLVAAFCAGCGHRGPIRYIDEFADEEAVFALAAADWNAVAELIQTAPTVRIEGERVGVTDADKAELDRIAASIENEQEPATESPNARGDAAQGSNEASDTSGGPDGSTQVPETAGGGGSEGASESISESENKQADEADRLRRFLKREGLSQSGFAKMSGASQPGVSALVRGAYVSPKERRRIAAFLNAADSLDHTEGLSVSSTSNEAAKSDRRKSNGPRRHPIAERIEAYLTRTGQSVWSGLFSVADQTVYNILHGSMPKAPTIEKLRRELDQLERDEVLANQPIDESKIERLPNNYDELNTGVNPLPKHEAPPRCSRTP